MGCTKEALLKGLITSIGEKALTESDFREGVMDALRVGIDNAVNNVSQDGGYSNNSRIKIPLPESLSNIEKLIRVAGYGSVVDEFQLSMNRAAERAAPEAKTIFWNAIKQMSIQDAKGIVQGGDNAATLYFKDKTYDQLFSIFKPIVNQSMSEVGVTRSYQTLTQDLDSMPFANNFNLNLEQYVTSKALDGLFSMMANEEKSIRENPQARVTEILRKVFEKQ
jgi:hypothetical protein